MTLVRQYAGRLFTLVCLARHDCTGRSVVVLQCCESGVCLAMSEARYFGSVMVERDGAYVFVPRYEPVEEGAAPAPEQEAPPDALERTRRLGLQVAREEGEPVLLVPFRGPDVFGKGEGGGLPYLVAQSMASEWERANARENFEP